MARPKEAILSQGLIRDQALAIIDDDGLDALTMRRLATRLGVQAASLYAHFANKDAVLDSIADRLARRIDPTGFQTGWQDGLRTWAHSYYVALHWHPNAAPIVAAGARERADYLAMADRVHGGMVEHGWPAGHATMVSAAVTFLVLGAATTASGERVHDQPGPARSEDVPPGSQIEQVADTVNRASFELALDSLLRGLEPVFDAVRVQPARARTGSP